jgi:hypothetical protein
MRLAFIFLIVFASLKIQAQITDNLEIKQLGLVDKNNYYSVLDACSKFDVSIKSCKRLFFSNKSLIKGSIISEPFFEECKTKYCKDSEQKIPIIIYKGVNDEINRKIIISKKFHINCCGRFKIHSSFKKSENIYIQMDGYSLVEIKIGSYLHH